MAARRADMALELFCSHSNNQVLQHVPRWRDIARYRPQQLHLIQQCGAECSVSQGVLELVRQHTVGPREHRLVAVVLMYFAEPPGLVEFDSLSPLMLDSAPLREFPFSRVKQFIISDVRHERGT
jgi:hypothetical protein